MSFINCINDLERDLKRSVPHVSMPDQVKPGTVCDLKHHHRCRDHLLANGEHQVIDVIKQTSNRYGKCAGKSTYIHILVCSCCSPAAIIAHQVAQAIWFCITGVARRVGRHSTPKLSVSAARQGLSTPRVRPTCPTATQHTQSDA